MKRENQLGCYLKSSMKISIWKGDMDDWQLQFDV